MDDAKSQHPGKTMDLSALPETNSDPVLAFGADSVAGRAPTACGRRRRTCLPDGQASPTGATFSTTALD